MSKKLGSYPCHELKFGNSSSSPPLPCGLAFFYYYHDFPGAEVRVWRTPCVSISPTSA